MHDLLAFLAERMLEMNKAKQQEIRGFTGWLEKTSKSLKAIGMRDLFKDETRLEVETTS